MTTPTAGTPTNAPSPNPTPPSGMPLNTGSITVALVDDYDVVLVGVAHMLDSYRDRVVIAPIDATEPLHDRVDIVI